MADRIQFLDRVKKSDTGDVPEERPRRDRAAPAPAPEEDQPPAGAKDDADNLPF